MSAFVDAYVQVQTEIRDGGLRDEGHDLLLQSYRQGIRDAHNDKRSAPPMVNNHKLVEAMEGFASLLRDVYSEGWNDGAMWEKLTVR